MPALIFNSGALFPGKPAFWAWPQRLHIDFLEPISIDAYEIATVNDLKDKAYSIMSTYYAAHEQERN